MKRIIIPVAAALFFCGVVTAQMKQKEPASGIATAANKTVGYKPNSNTSGVTPVKTTTPATRKATTIKKRHHHHRRHHHVPKKG